MPLPYGSTGYPITSSNELYFGGNLSFSYVNDSQGNTTYLPRVSDCNLFGWTLGTQDKFAGSIYNKIFSPSIFLNDAFIKPNDGSSNPISTDVAYFGIIGCSLNGLSLQGQATKGCTLFVKYGNDYDSTNPNNVPYTNVREGSAMTAVTLNGWTFSTTRYSSISLGMRALANANPGLTGIYTYYLINAHPSNYGEIVWRLQFSFAGVTGSSPGVTAFELHDPIVSWYDVYANNAPGPLGTKYWSNADGCMQGPSGGANPATQSYPTSNVGDEDPFPRIYDINSDYVQ